MKYQKTLLTLALLASAAVTGTAQASLFDRGGGLLYDDVLNVTWLQDANYAHTSGYALADSNGRMDWNTATTWAADLVYGGYSDWRLASNTPVNGSSFNYNLTPDGSTDYSYNITNPNSELAYMYHVNLGLKDSISATGVYQPNISGIFGNGNTGGQANVGLVTNLQSYLYWSGSEYAPDLARAWDLVTYDGSQTRSGKNASLYAWAVRPGDVSAVPVPGAVWLFGSGLLGLLGFKKRKAV
jgi:hypothetical protein